MMDSKIGHVANGVAQFNVIYVGCIGISKSMRELDFDLRSQITRECITKVAEAGNRITTKKRKINKKVLESIQGVPDLNRAGVNVDFVISTSNWTVKTGANELLFLHLMPTISFASAGEGGTADFIGYVAKTDTDRRCYVFECSPGIAQQVISTIGEAFRLRFEMSTQSTTAPAPAQHRHDIRSSARPITDVNNRHDVDMSGFGSPVSPPSTLPRYQPPPMTTPSQSSSSFPNGDSNQQSRPPQPAHRYQNENLCRPTNGAAFNTVDPTILAPTNFDLLEAERWFHGQLSRDNAELLVRSNGDFLVRQSEKNPSQFVLTGMQDSVHKHLLLIDDEGKVRTKDREFDDICHLIQYHRENRIPITSSESSLMLQTPICRQMAPSKVHF